MYSMINYNSGRIHMKRELGIAEFARRYGEDYLLDCLERNEEM